MESESLKTRPRNLHFKHILQVILRYIKVEEPKVVIFFSPPNHIFCRVYYSAVLSFFSFIAGGDRFQERFQLAMMVIDLEEDRCA